MGATVLVHSQVTVLLGYLILHQSLVKLAAMQLNPSICPLADTKGISCLLYKAALCICGDTKVECLLNSFPMRRFTFSDYHIQQHISSQ